MIEGQHTAPKRARIVVAHDWLCGRGGVRGGEQVLDRVCALVLRDHEPAGLLTMFEDGYSIGRHVDEMPPGRLRVSWLNRVPAAATRLRRWLLPLYPSAIRDLSGKLAAIHRQSPIDLLISTSSAAVKGLKPPPGVPHLCYCFSPARYVWGQGEQYGGDGTLKGRVRSAGLRLLGGRFRAWDLKSAGNVTQFIAISGHIRERIRAAYGVDSNVIHPPARTDYFTPDEATRREHFWLCVGAVEPYKRTELAIEAAVLAGEQLKVAGDGSRLSALRHKYRDRSNIEFLGRVSDEALRDLYRRASVLVFPQEEDFGIVAVEALACGLPVVALARGGAVDIVVDGESGSFFEAGDAASITQAVKQAPRSAANACRARALLFAEDRFDRELAETINALLRRAPAPFPR